MTKLETLAIRQDFSENQAAILATVLSSTHYGILLTDLVHRSIACNARFGELFGIDIRAVVENEVHAVRRMVAHRIPDIVAWENNLSGVYKDPNCEQHDLLELKNPQAFLRRSTLPVLDGQKQVMGRLWTFLDVSAEQRRERLGAQLVRISHLVDPDPGYVYREIVEIVGELYQSICLLSIREGDFMRFRAVGGPPSPAREMPGNHLPDSYCQFCLESDAPLIIQDAQDHQRGWP